MEYITDLDEFPETHSLAEECYARVGLTEQDIGMVKLKGLGTQFLAVGLAGKRSCMLASVLAIAIQDSTNLKDGREGGRFICGVRLFV